LTSAAARSLLEFRAARAADASATLSPAARQRLAVLWDDPAAPDTAAQNRGHMEAVLRQLGML
jgi:hypothetical protein